MSKTILIIGATGGIGSETARALLARGWTVRGLTRDPEVAARRFAELGNITWLRGDAMNQAEVVAAASGVDAVMHAANPPGYRNWQGLALPMLESSIAAAKAASARLVFPGTVYNFGPEVLPTVAESAPQRPRTRKGAIRVAMEQRLERASRDGVPVLIVRAGDFFGASCTTNSWFNQGMIKPGKPLRSVSYPGQRNVGHDWAYLPDLAETFAALLERADELSPFEVFHFQGHWFERGVEFAEATQRVAGAPSSRIRGFPWPLLYLAAPFMETLRETLEMRYLWQEPLRLDNRKLVQFLGQEPHTPLDLALRTTLESLGCLASEPHASGKSTNQPAPSVSR